MKKTKYFYLILGVGVVIPSFLFISSVFALRLSDLTNEEAETEMEENIILPIPEIDYIEIQEHRERENVKVVLSGKHLLPTGGSVQVSFQKKGGGTVKVESFSYKSQTLLVFPVPSNVVSGNVIVSAKKFNTTENSKPFLFEFHPPEILFITGENGIAPGKTIKIWGKYLDGVFYRKNGRAKLADVKNAVLKGGDISVDGNLSVIELTLPEENFNKTLWVEKSCDRNGENCLKSNEISLNNVIPPIFSELQINYKSWEGKVYGKNFPEDESDFSLYFDEKKIDITSYSFEDNFAQFSLPCPLPPRAIVQGKYKEVESTPLLFTAKDSPTLFGVTLSKSEEVGKSIITLSTSEDIDISKQNICEKNNILVMDNKEYPITSSGGKYVSDDKDESEIPDDADLYVIFHGVMSNVVPFSKQEHIPPPHIFRLEGKYGFRPGVPFTIFGRNLGDQYTSCSVGETIFNGPEIYFEEWFNNRVGTGDDGEPIFEKECRPIRPDVTPEKIEAQFTPLKYGEKVSQTSSHTVSVSVSKKQSNSIKIPFGDKNTTIVQSRPSIRMVRYPKGHLPGDDIIIYGNEFGADRKSNTVFFGYRSVTPKKSNNRGTELTVEIPAETKSGDIKVYRKSPNPQESEPYRISISPHKKRKLIFSFFEEQEDTNVELSTEDIPFSFPEIKYVNSFYDIQVNTFRLEIEWKEGDKESNFSMKNANISPFGVFSLKRNGVQISEETVGKIVGNKIQIEFPRFDIPLTEGESDTLELESSLLPFATRNSKFRLKFSPHISSHFMAINTESKRGIFASEKESIFSPWTTISKEQDNTCRDTLSSNIHCLQYSQKTRKNTSLTKKKQQERNGAGEKTQYPPKVLPKKEPKEENRKKEKKEESIQNKNTQEERIHQIVQQYGEKKAEKIIAILNKQKSLRKEKKESPKKNKITYRKNISEKVEEAKKRLKRKEPLYSILKNIRTDSDKDGLSDAEEIIIGTNPYFSDTDRDGYGDFLETEFGISPIEKKTEKIFSDISEAGTDASSISRLYFFGAIDGFPDGSFKPSQPISRATFIFAFSHIFFSQNTPEIKENQYDDVSSEDFFAPAIVQAKNANIPLPGEGNSFFPYQPISRGEACRMLHTVFDIEYKEIQKIEFDDVQKKDSEAITTCTRNKLIPPQDEENNIFGTNTPLTRAEASVLLYKAIFIQKKKTIF